MIPLDDTSDEEEGSEGEDGSGESEAEDAESDIEIEGASELLPSEDEADPPAPVQRKRRKAR
jgi:nuclear GTP-binding protein